VIELLTRLLALQDLNRPHTLLTRTLVSGIIMAGALVLHGFYGVVGGVVVYLIGVEGFSLPRNWMFAPLAVTLVTGLWSGARAVGDYWRNFGHG
jgi:hypothetical protein